jgi:hypothetical protein
MNKTTKIMASAAICSAAFMAGRLGSRDGTTAPPDGAGGNSTRSAPYTTTREATSRDTSKARGIAAGEDSASSSPLGRLVAEMTAITGMPDPVERTRAWLDFVRGLNAAELKVLVIDFRGRALVDEDLAADAATRMDRLVMGNDQLSEFTMLLAAWAKADPHGALAYARENTEHPFVSKTLLTTCATTDPEAALKWAEANHQDDGPNPWMESVIRGVAATDLSRATALLDSMHKGDDRDRALNTLLKHASALPPEAAREWAMNISDEGLRHAAIGRIAHALAQTDPKGMADWLMANPSENNSFAMDEVMSEMVKADPNSALDYIQNITDEGFKTHAFNGAVRHIGFEDIHLAAGFIDANPDFVTDEVRSMFIWQAHHRDPALGASAIANIHSESQRHVIYLDYFERWLERDPAAVTRWRAANDLPESVRPSVDRLIETMGKGAQ